MSRQPFSGIIPEDRLYCTRYDMWVQEIGSGEILVGASSFGIFRAGHVIAFTSKPNGAEISIDRGMGTIECRKTVLAVHAPVSFRLIEGNEAAELAPGILNKDPYIEGWMARGCPAFWEQERSRLVDAAAYCQHVLSVDPEASLG